MSETERTRQGTHQGGPLSAEQRARKRAKDARTSTRKHASEGMRAPCASYPGCNHAKHGCKT